MTGMIENIHVSLFLGKKEVARIHLPHGLLLVDSLIARSTQSKSNNEWWNKSANMQRMDRDYALSKNRQPLLTAFGTETNPPPSLTPAFLRNKRLTNLSLDHKLTTSHNLEYSSTDHSIDFTI